MYQELKGKLEKSNDEKKREESDNNNNNNITILIPSMCPILFFDINHVPHSIVEVVVMTWNHVGRAAIWANDREVLFLNKEHDLIWGTVRRLRKVFIVGGEKNKVAVTN